MSRDIYVFAEQRDGNIQKVGFELIGKGRELAAALERKVVAVLVGNGVKQYIYNQNEEEENHACCDKRTLLQFSRIPHFHNNICC